MDGPGLFLSYNSVDRPSVVAVQKLLAARGITTFLDRDQLVPGIPWPAALEEALRGVRAVAVLIGRELGGWQKREMWFALDRQVREEKQGHPFPVIPVLLAGADLTSSFLFTNSWIDLRGGLDTVAVAEPLDAFEHAINASTCTPPVPAERAAALCPYRGLEAFREEHAAFFAGRTSFASELFKFTVGKELVAVVGPSGSGKSSVVQAGLVPLLRRQLPPATTWDVITFTPGTDPFLRIASALTPLLERDLSETDRLAEAQKLGERLAVGGIGVESVIDRVIEKSNGTGRLLLVADQFEELFTLAPEPTRRPFAEALLCALGKAGFTLLVTLRADFYSQIITLNRDLSDRIAPAQVNIGALTREELRESITFPARLIGLKFEAGLVDRILHDVGSEPGNLPLLEFALTGLWSRRHGQTLTNGDYDEIGGVTGALTQRAETEFARFVPEQQTAARRLFSRLVRVARPDEGAEDTRQRIELQATDPVAENVALALAGPEVRLLVMGRVEGEEKTGHQTVEVAHEALIRNWGRLRGWLNEDREFLLWRQRTQIQVAQWEQHDGDASYLLRGVSLAEAERWLVGRPQDLMAAEQRFIQESLVLSKREREEQDRRRQAELENAKRLKQAAEERAQAEQQRAAEQTRRARILRLSSLALGALLLLALTTVVFALWERSVARARELVATSREIEDTDPELSVLTAMQSVAATWPWGRTILPEAEQQLQRAILAFHLRLTLHVRTGVYSVAWSPDGKRLATACGETPKLWDAERGMELLTLRGHAYAVFGVTFSPDGKRLATASEDQTAKVWDAESGKELLTLRGHSGAVSGVAFSPDGKRLATASWDNSAKVWDAESGRELLTLHGQSDRVSSVAWSPDGKRLATGGHGNTAKVWDAGSGKEMLTLHGHSDRVSSVAWSPDGKWLATGSADYTAKLWDANSGNVLMTLGGHTSGINSVAWNTDGKQLATGSEDGTAKVWDAAGGMLLLTLRGHRFFEVEALSMSGPTEIKSVAWSPDGNWLATGSNDTTARVWDTTSNKELQTLSSRPGNNVECLAWSPDGKRLATGNWDRTVKVWDADSARELLTLKGHTDFITSVAWSPDGKRLATASYDNTAKVWDANSGKELLTVSGHGGQIHSVAWSPDGNHLATGSHDQTGKIWDAETGNEVVTFGTPGDDAKIVTWSPDGMSLATNGVDSSAHLWEAASGKRLLTLCRHKSSVWSVAWSPDGKRLATGSYDSTAKICEAESGQDLLTLHGHSDHVSSVAWSPDGKRLATGSYDSTAKVWDAESGEELQTLKGHTGFITSVAWSPDGRRLATGSTDGTVRVVYAIAVRDLMMLGSERVSLDPSSDRDDCKTLLHVEDCPPVPQLSHW